VLYQSTTDDDIRISLENMSKCVVGIYERWSETITVLKHFFPWFQILPSKKNIQRMKLVTGKESKDTLRTDIYHLLAQHNGCDMIIYDKMMELFDKQLQYISRKRII
jgi:hypothetical protein